MKDEDFQKQLIHMLKEPKTYLIKTVVKNVSRPIIFETLRLTIECQKNGGMKKAVIQNPQDEGEVKSAGGVFMTFLKKKVSNDVIKSIYKVEILKQKEKKTVLREMTKMFEQKNHE